MGAEFAEIEQDFRELRTFILHDLDQIVGLEGANYAAAALITCAHETLAGLRSGAPAHATFGETLPTIWQPVAQSLFDALRNGVGHGYATKTPIVRPSHRAERLVARAAAPFARRGERHPLPQRAADGDGSA
jgi:hypothetical protein